MWPSSSPSCSALGQQQAFSVDLAAAARRLLAFLRAAPPAGVGPRSVRRYEELWLPLAAGAGEAAMLVPPHDVQLVWLCHCFHHESYAAYCSSRFGRIIDRPSILDAQNEEYAEDCCRDVWAARYPSDPFDLECNEIEGNSEHNVSCDNANGEIVEMVRRYAGLQARFASPLVREGVYHVSAKQRYVRFLNLAKKVAGTELTRLVPSLDILLMWLSHQSFPASYATDMTSMAVMENVAKLMVSFGEEVDAEVIERTRTLWEEAHDEPYDVAGSEVDAAAVSAANEAFYWETAVSKEDTNSLYKSLQPRFILEVYVFLKGEFDKELSPKTSYGCKHRGVTDR